MGHNDGVKALCSPRQVLMRFAFKTAWLSLVQIVSVDPKQLIIKRIILTGRKSICRGGLRKEEGKEAFKKIAAGFPDNKNNWNLVGLADLQTECWRPYGHEPGFVFSLCNSVWCCRISISDAKKQSCSAHPNMLSLLQVWLLVSKAQHSRDTSFSANWVCLRATLSWDFSLKGCKILGFSQSWINALQYSIWLRSASCSSVHKISDGHALSGMFFFARPFGLNWRDWELTSLLAINTDWNPSVLWEGRLHSVEDLDFNEPRFKPVELSTKKGLRGPPTDEAAQTSLFEANWI